MNSALIKIPVIVGPTATGKTATAIIVAEMFNAEIVSADSRQVYKGMETGSGAPSRDELAKVQHHLISSHAPDKRLSAGEYAHIANQAIDQIIERGKQPIVVGGSGLYVRALIDGLSPIPKPDPGLREAIQQEIDERGMQDMIDELHLVDPDYAKKIEINDRKRLVRAVEVWRLTGKPLSKWHSEITSQSRFDAVMFGLTRPRVEIHSLIEGRVRKMVDCGWIEEIKNLTSNYGGHENLPETVVEGLGYRELLEYLKGNTDLDEAIEKTVISTRQFAKRQMTWFRADERIQWLEESGDKAVDNWADRISDRLKDRGFRQIL